MSSGTKEASIMEFYHLRAQLVSVDSSLQASSLYLALFVAIENCIRQHVHVGLLGTMGYICRILYVAIFKL